MFRVIQFSFELAMRWEWMISGENGNYCCYLVFFLFGQVFNILFVSAIEKSTNYAYMECFYRCGCCKLMFVYICSRTRTRTHTCTRSLIRTNILEAPTRRQCEHKTARHMQCRRGYAASYAECVYTITIIICTNQIKVADRSSYSANRWTFLWASVFVGFVSCVCVHVCAVFRLKTAHKKSGPDATLSRYVYNIF